MYNGYGVDKTVTSTGVGLLDGMGILLGMDTPTIGFATEQEINENFKLWTADDAMYKFNFKVDGDELNSSTVLPGMKIPANGYASWTVTLKNANALNAAQTKKLLIKECKIGETPLTGLSSGGASMMGLDVPTAANMEVPFETETARLDVTVPLSITVCVAKDGTLAQPSADRMYVENRSAFPVNTQVKPMLTRLAADSGDAMRQIDAPKIGEGTGYDLAIRRLTSLRRRLPLHLKPAIRAVPQERWWCPIRTSRRSLGTGSAPSISSAIKCPAGRAKTARPRTTATRLPLKRRSPGSPKWGSCNKKCERGDIP